MHYPIAFKIEILLNIFRIVAAAGIKLRIKTTWAYKKSNL